MKNIVIQGWMVALIILVVMFGGIYLTIGTGHWATSRTTEPITLESGEYDPADIRGSYTFAEIEQFFGIPKELLFKAFLIPEEKRTDTFMIKDMHEEMFAPVVIEGVEIEVGTDLVRVFTSLYSGLPYESTETTHLPVSMVNVLIDEQKLDDEQTAYWRSHTFDLVLLQEGTAESQEGDAQTQTPEPDDTKPNESLEGAQTDGVQAVEMKGSTTLGTLLEYGLTIEQFKEIFGVDFPDDATITFKDFTDQHGLDRETIKTKITEALQ